MPFQLTTAARNAVLDDLRGPPFAAVDVGAALAARYGEDARGAGPEVLAWWLRHRIVTEGAPGAYSVA